jgi:acyl carrier protein
MQKKIDWDMQKAEKKFFQIFKYMGIPKEEIRMDASFVKDFEFEEFQFGYLVFYLESYFRITIRENEYSKLNTIGNAMNFVRIKLRKREHLKISRRKNRSVETFKSVPRISPRGTKASCFQNFAAQPCFVPELQYEF